MRILTTVLVMVFLLVPTGPAQAQSLSDRFKSLFGGDKTAELTQAQAAEGLKEALARGVDRAIGRLGRKDGFLGDQAVRIPVPEQLETLTGLARRLGAGDRVDAFEQSMNRAAEQAVPEAASILGDAVRAMTLDDAISIVRDGETAATDYFRRNAEDRLREAFRPIVEKTTDANGVARALKGLSSQAGGRLGGLASLSGGAISDDELDLDRYVTDRALDGLFYYIAEEEKAIRRDPVGRGSDLLETVFGRSRR